MKRKAMKTNKVMKKRAYWGRRVRYLGDLVSKALAGGALLLSGLEKGEIETTRLGLTVAGLVLAFVLWLAASYISAEMDGGGAGAAPDDDE